MPMLMSLLLSLTMTLAQAPAPGADGWREPPPSPPPPPAAAAELAGGAPPRATASDAARRPAPKVRSRRSVRRARPQVSPPLPSEPQVTPAAAIRDELLVVREKMEAQGSPEQAAPVLHAVGERAGDPLLVLAAAHALLVGERVDRATVSKAIEMTRRAEELAANPAAPHAADIVEQAQQLRRFGEQRQELWLQLRRGRAEVITGGVFLAVAVSGIGMIASGAILATRIDARQAADPRTDPAYSDELTAGKQRSETLLAAGFVSGIAGLAVGLPLTLVGHRDLKASREHSLERPRFRITPALAGLSVSGRF